MTCNRQDGLLVDNATNVVICSDEHHYTELNECSLLRCMFLFFLSLLKFDLLVGFEV